MNERHKGLTAKIVEVFVDSRLSLLLLIGALLAGVAGLVLTPREEEPQIVVPLVDVLIDYPGASPDEVERTAVVQLESLVRGLPGVEHVYSEARDGAGIVSVRFEVGHERERALVDTFTRINANLDRVPPGMRAWVVRPVDIDDVPFVTLALHSDALPPAELRRLGEELSDRLGAIDDVSLTEVIGGSRRVFRVTMDPARLAAHRVAPLDVARALRGANVEERVGTRRRGGAELTVRAGDLLRDGADLEGVVVGVQEGRPVHVGDVATVVEDTLEPAAYTRIAFGAAAGVEEADVEHPPGSEQPSVSISVAKRKGSNAVRVADEVLAALAAARGELLPAEVGVTVTRNDGATADRKVNELVEHIAVAIVTVVLVLMLGLGWREALVVAIAIPVTFSVALFFDLATGYTINRVTLFALVLSLGLLVDDPIVDVENIHRHFALRDKSPRDAVVYAVNEVRPPLIMATLTVIISFLPMYFITGMMGPYMAPMPFNITVVMLTSLAVALTITPWASYHILKPHEGEEHAERDPLRTIVGRVYAATMRPLMGSKPLALGFFVAIGVTLLASAALPLLGLVPLKMLPFGNKDRLQVVVELPEGTALEETDRVVRELADYLLEQPEVVLVESFAGVASPHDFQGLVRHEFLRAGDAVGDLRVGLLPGDLREHSSHQVALRLRPGVEEVARRNGARVRLSETPPGPPVLQTVVAEITAPPTAPWDEQVAVAADVRARMEAIGGIVDVDWMTSEPTARVELTVDQEKAARHGVSTDEVVGTLALCADEQTVTAVRRPGERRPLPVVLQLDRATRSHPDGLATVPVRFAPDGAALQLGSLTREREGVLPRSITRKDGRRVVYVTADAVGISPADAVFALQGSLRDDPLPDGFETELGGEGEWKITLDVFRDLGIAFAAALIGIYVVLVGQTRSLLLPVVMMVAIPITAIGIFPGFWLINLLRDGRIGELADPTWFTATAMIGMIALAGIVVRNSVILIDFIQVKLDEGAPLERAVLEAGSVRLRPILLTATTSLLGVWVMTLDPIFSGLAWSFIFGILASTTFTLLVVPLIYYLQHRGDAAAGAAR